MTDRSHDSMHYSGTLRTSQRADPIGAIHGSGRRREGWRSMQDNGVLPIDSARARAQMSRPHHGTTEVSR
jgi:hypothetical protein